MAFEGVKFSNASLVLILFILFLLFNFLSLINLT